MREDLQKSFQVDSSNSFGLFASILGLPILIYMYTKLDLVRARRRGGARGHEPWCHRLTPPAPGHSPPPARARPGMRRRPGTRPTERGRRRCRGVPRGVGCWERKCDSHIASAAATRAARRAREPVAALVAELRCFRGSGLRSPPLLASLGFRHAPERLAPLEGHGEHEVHVPLQEGAQLLLRRLLNQVHHLALEDAVVLRGRHLPPRPRPASGPTSTRCRERRGRRRTCSCWYTRTEPLGRSTHPLLACRTLYGTSRYVNCGQASQEGPGGSRGPGKRGRERGREQARTLKTLPRTTSSMRAMSDRSVFTWPAYSLWAGRGSNEGHRRQWAHGGGPRRLSRWRASVRTSPPAWQRRTARP